MNLRLFSSVALLSVLILSCRKNDGDGLAMAGRIYDVRNNSGLGGVEITLDEQVVEDGALNSTFNTAGTTTTSGDGSYRVEFDRKNALIYRVDFEKDGYFDRRLELNPEDFRPGETREVNLALVPQATFEVRIVNTQPESEDDQIRFRNLDANFNCECCTNDFVVLDGMNVDTTFSCLLHGDYLIHFVYEIFKSTDSTVVDSVYCPAFQTTAITIEY